MKNIKYTLFTIIILFISVFHVNASCTNEEISALKELADDIKITYKHKGIIETDEVILYNQFDVTVKNLSDDFYILYMLGSKKIVPNNGIVTIELNNGEWLFEIYSKKCSDKIYEITFKLPKFNIYSLDPLCEGVDGKDFPLCGKYYEYDVSHNNFVERVKHYRTIHKISNNGNVEKEEKTTFQIIYDAIISFLIKYKLYIIISIILILITIIAIIVIKKREKRGVLE